MESAREIDCIIHLYIDLFPTNVGRETQQPRGHSSHVELCCTITADEAMRKHVPVDNTATVDNHPRSREL